MIFRKLTMAGFKSFAEKAEIEIEPGLTGIVGPNGCGKSNIVEGLRFIMGESSARQMRGADLDEIIFAGTEHKPSRNFAEITLYLEHQHKHGPAEHAPTEQHDQDDLEVTRKIERGKGSQFQINGKPARAKDVQLLFADVATGARANGMVSQGRIGAIVGAKPEDRRSLIEEAANIKGLHQRKHEAELRLKGTETNLERLEDIITQLAEQRQQLARQARQAARYRSVADRLRKAEARLAYARWHDIDNQTNQAQAEHEKRKQQVEQITLQVAQLSTKQAEQATTMPELRQAETEQAARVQAMRIEINDCDKETTHIAEQLDRLETQLKQIKQDSQAETNLRAEAERMLTDLQTEEIQTQETLTTQTPLKQAAEARRQQAQQASTQSQQRAAECKAQLESAQQAEIQHAARLDELKRRIETASHEAEKLDIERLTTEAAQAKIEQQQAETDYETSTTHLNTCTAEEAAAKQVLDEANAHYREADAKLARLTAESDALSALLVDKTHTQNAPALDQIEVQAGMEQALAACLGADLMLPFEQGEAGFWRQDMEEETSLQPPELGTPLAQFMSGAVNLKRALQGIAVIDEDAHALATAQHATLKPGQALVTKSGKIWRWDGVMRVTTAHSEAERMRQKHRLVTLTTESETLTMSVQARQGDAKKAEQNWQEAKHKAVAASEAVTHARDKRDAARRKADNDGFALTSAETRKADLDQAVRTAQSDLEGLHAQTGSQGGQQALAEQLEAANIEAQNAQSQLEEARIHENDIQQTLHAAQQKAEFIQAQKTDWHARLKQSTNKEADMQQREQHVRDEQTQLSDKPSLLAARKQQLSDQMEEEEAKRQQKSDERLQAESALRETEQQLRQKETELSSQREGLIRTEAKTDQLAQARLTLTREIHEKLDCTPDELNQWAEIEEGQEIEEPIDKLEQAVRRLLNERDQIGPVNLRAETEMTELDERVTQTQAEHDDLTAAIAKLRHAITTLNREGRARLMESFDHVNGHFKTLFSTLFGGGEAELRLTDEDEPLTAGLEILASPPGKKLQSLSLLSGGEQALTALAIIFAVFLTNPAPICVLDEVDAPLDDSNVARFCDLLRDIAGRTQTRFLVVTHHRMTMARMDRLFGVTMEIRGVSRLVSVDLQTAAALRDAVSA